MTTHFTLGDISIHRVVEQQLPFVAPLEFFPTLTPALLEENLTWMQPDYIDPATGKLVICVQSYLVRTRHHNILIDACVGNHKSRPTRPVWDKMVSDQYEKSLAATGLSVGDIDYVMCTHLHIDHVGWNTRLDNGRWVPTFPKAKYLFSDRELAYWTETEKANPASCPWITDSVLPIVAANRVEVVKSDHALDDAIRLMPTPGHTIDHFSVHVGKPGEDALIAGDLIHSPLQARYPELGMRADYDSTQAGITRRKVFDRFCDSSTLLCTVHFPSPSIGRITRWDDAFRIVSVSDPRV
ncbi:MAG TPA: MBL fold metallo-hydrolase [Hyphomicrobiaceae bacterium]|jgi:glyoxylase-like metal-dependent hydrolase (beta-lactamase superfamily II)|nr:MBL fold metallo-hydrolase [Hyphomicrobiaceae bacterium]